MQTRIAAVALCLVLTGCAPATNPTASPSQSASQSQSPSASPSPTATSPEFVTANAYFATSTPVGIKLAVEPVRVEKTSENLDELVVGALISGKLQPADHDYVNLWDASNQLNSITVANNRATIDINLGKLNVGAEGEHRAIDQLVYTLTSLDRDVKSVKLLVNGKSVESLAGHVDTTGTFRRGNGIDQLMSVQLTSIFDNQEVSGDITLSGKACTYEAQVVWVLKQGKTTVDKGTTQATTACPLRSSFSVKLGTLDPGTYTLTVKDISAKDGSLITEDTKTFTVK